MVDALKKIKRILAIGSFALCRYAERRRDRNELLAHPKRLTSLRVKPLEENSSLAENRKGKRDFPAGHGETILIVDDESAIRETTKAILSRTGYNALVADDGSAALALFLERWSEIDVVLTDLAMPAVNGSLLVQVLRKMASKVKIIICSGQAVDDMPVQLRTIDIQGYLTKPYTHESLLRMVDRVLHDLF
jgi:CheY-like chemotaxis protein